MPVSRNPNHEYSAEYLADVPLIEPAIQIRDEDGNLVDAGSDNPIPISNSLKDYTEVVETNQLLKIMIDEQKKTNLYLAEILGDTFDETR